MSVTSQLNLCLALELDPDAVDYRLQRGNIINCLKNLLTDVEAGRVPGKLFYYIDDGAGTAATQTVAFTQANGDAGDTVTVCGIVFTVAASPSSDPSDGEFAAVTDDDTTGANFATAFNAHPDAKGLGTAANSSGTVTITMTNKGVFHNMGGLATSDATFVTLGDATFANGAVSSTVQRDITVVNESKTLP